MQRRKASAALYRQVRQDVAELRKDEAAWLAAFGVEAPGKTLRAAFHGLLCAFHAADYARGKQFLDLLQPVTIADSNLLVAMRRLASCAVGDYRFVFVQKEYVTKTGEVVRSSMSDPLNGASYTFDRVQSLARGTDRFDFGHGECERLIEKVICNAICLPAEFPQLNYREHHSFKPVPARFEEELCASCFAAIDSFAAALRCTHCDAHVHSGACQSEAETWSRCAAPHKKPISAAQHARNYRWETLKLLVYSFRKKDGAFAVLPKDLVKYLLAMI